VVTDHVAGHKATVKGTAKPRRVIILHGTDAKHGSRTLGDTTSSSTGHWHVTLTHGVLYNTVLRATSGVSASNRAHLNVHQVLKINGRGGRCHYSTGQHCAITFVGETSAGFRYRLKGSSRSHVPGERITVTRNGHVLGKARMHSNGTYTVTFVVNNRGADGLVLVGTGVSRSGRTYTKAGHRSFSIAG
jgi:hypothetical protein